MTAEEKKPEESNAPKSKVDYTFDPETREISRTDLNGSQVLATLIDGVLEYKSDKTKKFHPVVVRFLGDEGLKFETMAIAGAPRDNVRPSEIPKPPKKSIRFGDKTPEYVEWMKKYKPEEYKARYGIRGPGVVTKTEHTVTPQGRPAIRKYKKDAIIATRKTHLTELADPGSEDEEDES